MSERAGSGRDHPDLETIAALLDARLAGAEREAVTAHLADCDDCREVFAETARFRGEEGVVRTIGGPGDESDAAAADTPGEGGPRVLRPPGGRWRRSRTWVVTAVAAAAAVTAVVVWTPVVDRFGLGGAAPSVADLAAALPDAATLSPTLAATWDRHGFPVMRGGAAATTRERQTSFQIGVRVVEMDLALSAGEAELATRLTYELETLLGSVESADALRVLYAGENGVRDRLGSGEPPADLLPLNRQADELLPPDQSAGFPGFVNGLWYGLGRWAGAAHLAAAAGDAEFFASRPGRTFLGREELAALPAEVAAPVARLRELTADDPGARLPEIESELRRLIAVAGGGTPETEPG